MTSDFRPRFPKPVLLALSIVLWVALGCSGLFQNIGARWVTRQIAAEFNLDDAQTEATHSAVKRVMAAATHPVLSGPALERIMDSPLEELIVTDTIPLREEAKQTGRFRVLSVASLLGEAIKRIHHSDSVSSLFV